jgi:RecA/RadA recombinase
MAPRPAEMDRETAPVLPPAGVTDERAIPTGFGALDAILGLGGLPRTATTAVTGDGTSGKTTLALQAVAQVQAAGGIAAYLDLARSLDPVEAVARGVQLDWLVVLTPESLAEALAMAAMLLQDRTVDLLLLDLPSKPLESAGVSNARLAERIHRLAAMARRAGVQMLVLEPPGLPAALLGALTQEAALRLELSRRAWIRLGRDVVGQRTEVRVSRDRFGPPGRAAELRILYADGGLRDDCLTHEELLRETSPAPSRSPIGLPPPGILRPAAHLAARPSPLPRNTVPFQVPADATPSSLLAPPPHPPGSRPVMRAFPGGADRAGRPALGRRSGTGREPIGVGARGQSRDAAGSGSPARS